MQVNCFKHHVQAKLCDKCIVETTSERALQTAQMADRLDHLWDQHPELHREMLRLEDRFPLTGVQILTTVPFPQGRGESMSLSLLKLLADTFHTQLAKHQDARIGANDDGFYIYKIRRANG